MRRRNLDPNRSGPEKGLAWAATLSLFIASCAGARPTPTSSDLAEVGAEFDRAAGAFPERDKVPSVVLGVVQGDRLVWSYCRGTPDGTPDHQVTIDTLYRIGSLTKLFTDLALVQLKDRGKLSLDDPLSRWVPEINGVVYPTAEHPPIAMRQLITHYSGLPSDGPSNWSLEPFPGLAESALLLELKGLLLTSTPGTEFLYSNLAIALVGLAIARASARPYEAYVTEEILRPLGMTSTEFEIAEGVLDRSAKGLEQWDGRAGKSGLLQPLGAYRPAGGLVSNLRDLARFASFEMSAWPPRDAPESAVISRAALRSTQVPPGLADGVGAGWGLERGEHRTPVIVHEGLVGDQASALFIAPRRGVAVIALANGPIPDALGRLSRQLMGLALDSLPPIPKELTGETAEVIQRLLLWMNGDPAIDLAELFPVRDQSLREQLLSELGEFRNQMGGSCRLVSVEEAWVGHALVRIKCARREREIKVRTAPVRPSYLQGFSLPE